MEERSCRKVFIVEDNAFYASLMKNELERFCGNISVFPSGEKCIENIDLMPDIVLLDQNLSGTMSGIDVLKRIKEYNKHIQVIFVSGASQIDLAKDAIDFGAIDYIIKNGSTFDLVENKVTQVFNYKEKKMEMKIDYSSRRITLCLFILMVFFLIFFIFNHL